MDHLDDHSISTELSRELNLFHLTMMGAGMMIGAGVFLGIGNAMRFAGPGGVLLTLPSTVWWRCSLPCPMLS